MTVQRHPGRFFASPNAEKVRLDVEPQLASWDAASHPSQVKLRAFLGHAKDALSEPLAGVRDAIALRLDVGLPHVTELLDAHDLDNYAYPLAKALVPITGRRIVSVWCGKSPAAGSTVAVATAELVPTPTFACLVEAVTSVPADTVAYKQQIHDQIPPTATMPAGPIALQIAFTVSPKRNWMNLWKPTIDTLDALLGRTRTDRDWHPLDGRIVELGLHCTYDPGLGNNVQVTIGADLAELENGNPTQLS